MKKIAIASILALSLPMALNAAPVDAKGKQYDMVGRISVHGTGKCYGHSVSAGKVSPVDIFATIKFGESDITGGTFDWSNDSLMVGNTTSPGEILERNGNKMALQFTGKDAQTAGSVLFTLANIPTSSGGDSPVSINTYSLNAEVTKKNITVTEQVSISLDMPEQACSFKWTVKRKMKGNVVVPAPV